MKIAVIGGEGYLGHYVTKYFNADSLSRRNGFDVTSPIGNKLESYNTIIHMASKVDKTGKNNEEVFRTNLMGTKNLVNSLNKNQTIIFTSTKEVYDPNKNSYGISKLEAEEYIKKCSQEIGFRFGIFRMASIYAPDTNGKTFVNYFIDAVKNEKEISLLLEGKQIRDFLYVDDLSLAFEKFIKTDNGNHTFDIGGGIGNSTTLGGLVKIIGEIAAKAPIISFSEDIPKGELHYVTNIENIARELKWSPKIFLREGLKKIIYY